MEVDHEVLEFMERSGSCPEFRHLARAVRYLLDKVEPKEAPADDLLARQIKSAETIRAQDGDCHKVACCICPIYRKGERCPVHTRLERITSWLAAHKPAEKKELTYKCQECGAVMNDGEGRTFTVCSACWDKHKPATGSGCVDEDKLAAIVFNSDGEEIGRTMASRIMGALRRDYHGLYNALNPIKTAVNLDALDGEKIGKKLMHTLNLVENGNMNYPSAVRDILRKVKEALR